MIAIANYRHTNLKSSTKGGLLTRPLLAMALASACIMGAAPIFEAPAAAQSDVQRMTELARPYGTAGGTYTLITIPPDADIIGMRLYADSDSLERRIFGVKLRYQTADGAAYWTPTMGSAEGKAFEFTPRAGERVNRMTVWTRRNGALAGVHLGTNANAYGVFARRFDGKRTIDVGRGREFGGLTARTDGRFVLALGLIAFDPDNPEANLAWASNPPRGYDDNRPQTANVDPRAPWETNPRPTTAQNAPPRAPVVKPPVSKPPTTASTPPASTPQTSAPPTSTSADWKPDFDESAEPFGLIRFENRWKPDQRIDTPEGTSVITRVAPDGYWGAQWILEPVGVCCIRIRNRWTETYLVNRNGSGPVKLSGDIEEDDRRALWAVERVDNEPFLRIRNLYNDASLHIQNGELVAGVIRPNWWSAQWNVEDLDGKSIIPPLPDQAQNGAGSGDPQPEVPASQPPIPLTIVHKGAFLVDMRVTFTEPGKLPAQILNESRVVVGNNQQVQIPYAARSNVKVQISAEGVTRRFPLINKTISLDDGACILITGTIVTREAKQMTLEQCTK